MINTICFDLDSTLVDSELVILKAFDYVFIKYLPNDRLDLYEYRKFMGPTLYQTFSNYLSDINIINQMIQDFVDYYKTIELDIIKLYPGVKDTLIYLYNNKYNICLITNKFMSSANPSITYLDIKQYFNGFIPLDRQDNKPKPDPYAFKVAMDDYGVKEENILMVGDNEVDMMCAKNAGIKCALVTYNEWFEETKAKTNPDYVINNLTELIDILKKENGGL